MIKGIIFDLDNCILETRAMGKGVIDSVLEPLINSDLSADMKKNVQCALWTDSLEDTIREYRLRADVAEMMREAYRNLEVPQDRTIKTFGDEHCIALLPVKKYLVTSGYRKFQQSKINRLNIANLFNEIIIDASDDLALHKGKKKIFEEILEANGWDKSEVLIIGDNPRSELGTAKEMGIIAIQTLRPGVTEWKEADHYIHSLCELRSFL